MSIFDIPQIATCLPPCTRHIVRQRHNSPGPCYSFVLPLTILHGPNDFIVCQCITMHNTKASIPFVVFALIAATQLMAGDLVGPRTSEVGPPNPWMPNLQRINRYRQCSASRAQEQGVQRDGLPSATQMLTANDSDADCRSLRGLPVIKMCEFKKLSPSC